MKNIIPDWQEQQKKIEQTFFKFQFYYINIFGEKKIKLNFFNENHKQVNKFFEKLKFLRNFVFLRKTFFCVFENWEFEVGLWPNDVNFLRNFVYENFLRFDILKGSENLRFRRVWLIDLREVEDHEIDEDWDNFWKLLSYLSFTLHLNHFHESFQ